MRGRPYGIKACATIYFLFGTPFCMDSFDSCRLAQIALCLLFIWPASAPSRLRGKGGVKGHNVKKTPYREATPFRAWSFTSSSLDTREEKGGGLASGPVSFQDPALHSQTQWARLRV